LMYQTISGSVMIDTPWTITVVANTNGITKTELFSTGGSIGVISNQQTAVFSVPMNLLGVGLHPFYALVSDTFGNQFRTEPAEVRIVPPFLISITSPPLALSWSAIPGLVYDVWSSTNVSGPFQKVGTVTATGSSAGWAIPKPLQPQTYFRVSFRQ